MRGFWNVIFVAARLTHGQNLHFFSEFGVVFESLKQKELTYTVYDNDVEPSNLNMGEQFATQVFSTYVFPCFNCRWKDSKLGKYWDLRRKLIVQQIRNARCIRRIGLLSLLRIDINWKSHSWHVQWVRFEKKKNLENAQLRNVPILDARFHLKWFQR